jgi:hypothetical protein
MNLATSFFRRLEVAVLIWQRSSQVLCINQIVHGRTASPVLWWLSVQDASHSTAAEKVLRLLPVVTM